MSRVSVRGIGALCVLLVASALSAQTAYVSNGTGNWSTSTVWLPVGVPGAGDTVTIRNNDEISVTGSHTVDNVTLDASSGTHKLKILSGSLTIAGTGTALDLQAPASFGFSLVGMFGGSMTIPNGDVSIHGETSTFGQLDFASGGAVVDVGGNLDFTGSNPSIARLTFNDSGGGFLSIGGNLDGGGAVTATYGTITFDGTGAQTIGGPYTLHDAAILKVSGTATLGAALSLTGDLSNTVGTLDLNGFPLTVGGTLSNGGFFSGNGSTVTLLGDLTNSSTLFLLGGTLRLNGTALQTIDTPLFALNVGTLELNNLAGAALNGLGSASNSVSLQGGKFTVTSGFFLITAAATVSRSTGWFVGKLRMDFNASVPRTMHVGTAGSYMPIDVDPGSGGTIEAIAIDGLHPNRTGVNTLDRYWRITAQSSVSFLSDVTFHYNQSDVTNGSEAQFVLAQYTGSAWLPFDSSVNPVTNTGSLLGAGTYVADWAIGQRGSVGGASTLAITSVNGGVDPYVNAPFSVDVEARGDDGVSPGTVSVDSTVDILLQAGGGSLMTASGTITAGFSNTTVTGLAYDTAESNVQLRAVSASGDTLQSGTSAFFDVVAPSPTLTVTSLADSGPGSLRDVLTTLNGGGCSSPCTVEFGVAGTISLLSSLPAITFSNVTIDGFSAPGASANTNAFGLPSNAILTLILDGSAGAGVGLEIAETFVDVRGLVIHGFDNGGTGIGVKFSGDNSGSNVSGCYIGTSADGLTAAANGYGVVFAGSFESSVGGATPADRNVISGNAHDGVLVSDETLAEVHAPGGVRSEGVSAQTASNTISVNGSYIGTKADLSGALPNDLGISVCNGCSSVSIGGSGIGNVIGGNTTCGIRLAGSGASVTSNRIGTAGDSPAMIPNGGGIEISGSFNTVGGNSFSDVNVISASINGGIYITGDDNIIDHNRIGVAADGTTPAGNLTGISLGTGADRNRIGWGFGNTIASNGADGVLLNTSAGIGNTILSNAIFANGGQAIDFDDDGVTANDATDADSGPNHRQNYPVLNTATLNGGNIDVKLSLDSSGGVNVAAVVFDFFKADGSTPSQAKNPLGSSGCVTGAVFSNSLVNVTAGIIGAGDKIVATATAYSDVTCTTPSEGTSEVSPAVTVGMVAGSAADLDVSSFSPATPVAQNTLFTFDFFISNNGPDPATSVVFTAPIPPTLTFNSVTAPCTYNAGTVSCSFASIGSGNTASLTISLSTSNVPGTHTVTGSAAAAETDPDGSNNSIPTSVGVTGNALTVVNTNDSGIGSLRQALLDAQNNVCVAPCAIGFNIAAPPYVIQPALDLPQLAAGVSLDATTQPGYSGIPIVEIDSTLNINSLNTLAAGGNSATIRGFSLTNGNNGITLYGDFNTVEGNYVGLNPAGVAEGNDNGVIVKGNNNTVGGTAPNARNIISGNFAVGVRLETDATGNTVAGNYIGTDPTGSVARPNGSGVELIDTAAQNTIGGASAAHRNVISGNTSYGIRLKGEGVSVGFARKFASLSANAVNDTLIANNWIGPNAAGSGALGNGTAGITIEDDVSGTVIGLPGQPNTISANVYGIKVPGVNVGGTKISANSIGVATDGITPMGNTQSGILLIASGITIGGPAGNGNVIANSGGDGIAILGGATNAIQQNSIFNNGGLGIDIEDDGVTPNDADDSDGGPNGRQNFPNVTSATLNGGNLTVAYNIDSSGSGAGSIGIRIYKADSGASGEGKSFIGFACIAGNAFGAGTTFPAAVAIGDPIVLTATSYSDGACTTVADGTSEFSAPVFVASCAPPPATITASGPTSFCTGGSVTLTASAGASYLWSTGATTQAILVNSSGSYSVSVTDGAGCMSSSAPTNVTVNPPPVVTITGPINACDSAILGAGPGFTSYLWSTGATTQSITVTSSNTYSVNVTDVNGCTGSDSHSITVNTTPVATITPSGPTTFCMGGSVTLTANPAGASYSWSNGATTQSINVTTGGSYSVMVTGAGGCFNMSAPTTVTVNPAPIVNITGPLNACDSAILDAGPGFTSYLWSTGATTQTITVTSSNTYSVTVTNAGGCTVSDSHAITVNPTPVATITPSGPTTFCMGGSVTLTANPAGASYSWSNGATTQSINVTTGGSYSVTVTGAGGCFNTSAPTNVTVNPAPIVTITGPASACDSAILDAGPGFTSYLWSTGATSQTINVTSSNTYSVTVTNAGGCTATDSHAITVNPTPVASITPGGPTTFCAGGSVTLTASPAGASYLWNTGATTQSITVTTGGAYTVTVTGAGGCSNTSTGTNVTVNPAPAVTITGPNSACASATLDAGPGFASYLWSTGATTQTITVTTSNTYSVTVTNGGGCSGSDSHNVVINSAGAANITGPSSMCPGQSVVLDAGPGYTGYLWSTGETTQSIAVSPAGTTIYSVTVTDGGGCTGSDTHTLTVNPGATASVTPGGPTTFCDGGSVTLTANASASYLWSTGGTTQSIVVTAPGSYSVTVTDGNGCTATSAPMPVTVDPAAAVTITGPTSTCAAAPVVLDAGAGFTSYSWSTGATTQTITVAPAATATYSVTVTNGSGCSGTDSHTVTVTSNPVAAVTAPASVCSGANASASVAPIAGATYAWSIANGAFTSPTNGSGVTFTAGAGGAVNLGVIVTSGTCTSNGSQTIPISAPPTAAISGPTQVCPNTTFTLSAGSGFTSYLWSNGATTPSINLQQAAATQSYSVTVTNAAGCSATATHTVTLSPAASASISAPSSAVANSAGLTASAAAQAGAVYTWSITNGSITNGLGTNAITFTAGGSGTTRINLTVTRGSCSASGQRNVTITGAPPTGADLSIVKTAPSSISIGGSLAYSITVTNAGPEAASNLTITDPLPDGVALVSIDAPSLTCNRFSNVILCNGPLAIGASKTLTLTVTAPMRSGPITNSATVDAGTNDPNASNNSASATTNVLDSSDPCAGRAPVTPLTPANGSVVNTSLVDFSWTAAFNAHGYRLWLRLDDGPAASADTDETSLQLTIENGSGEWWIETLYEGCPSTESQHQHFTVPARVDCTTSAPETLAPPNGISVGDANVTFTWTSVGGALGYEVWLSAGGTTPTLLGSTNATSLTHLVPAGTLEWFVRAILDRCPSLDSQRARFTFAPPRECLDNLAPQAIAPLPDAKIGHPIDFAWTARPRATSYELFTVRGRGAPELVATTPNAFARGLSLPSGKLRWFVRAHFGDCPPLDSAEQKLEIVTPPQACATLDTPSISAAGQSSSGIPFVIQWDDVAGATGYELQLASNSSFSDAQLVSTSGTEHTLTRTNDGTGTLAVYARVRALDSRCQPATVTPYGPVAAIFILPIGTEGAAPLTGGPVGLRIVLGSELAGQTFSVSIKEPWLTVVPTSGIVAPGGTTLAVTAETTGLPLGTSLGAVRITLNTPASLTTAGGSIQANATTVKVPTMGISKVTPVTPAPKSAPPPDALIIPAVAHADGINAKFQSDVRVTNSSAKSLQYQVTFTPTGGAGSANGRQTTFSIDPGRTIALDDVLRSWFGTGGESVTGTLEVRPLTQTAGPTSSLPFSGLPDLVSFASSRTFNVTANGTFGQYIPAIPFANFIGQSNALLSLQQIAQSDRYRTNLGIVEGSGEAVSLLVKVFGNDGAKLKEFPVNLAGGEHTQLNSFLTTQGVGPLSDGRVEISVTSGNGKVTAYASVLDNNTSDPLLVTPVALNGTGATKWVIPGVADLNNGAVNWQTDMRLFNAGTADVEAALTFYSLNGGTPRTATVTIPAGQVRQFDKTLASVFGASNDGGAVHIATATDARLVATARTYNQTSTGTYGQFISGITPSEAAGLGSRPLQILQIEETDRFRSNVGLAEVTGNPVKLEIAIIPPDAKFTAVTEVQLQGNEFRQINSLLRSAGLAETYNARVSVRVIEGTGRVTAYASVIDMLTNDPTYVPAQ
jgi:uncharacterized repeat protein (TIGR01451 family)